MRPISTVSALILLALLFSSAVQGQWVATSGPGITNLQCLVAHDSDLFAGTVSSGLYRSTNDGDSWTPLTNGLPHYLRVTGLLVDGTNIYAASDKGLFRSIDRGDHWTDTKCPLNATPFIPLGVEGRTLLSGGYVSPDSGSSWTELHNIPNGWITLAVNGSVLYAGTGARGAFRSTNLGASWTEIDSGLLDPNIMAMATMGTALFVGTRQLGVFRSTDSGTTWIRANTGMQSGGIECFAALNGKLVAAGPNVYLSTDSGNSWTLANNGLTDGTLAFASNARYIFATGQAVVWRRPLSEMIATSAVAEQPTTQRNIYAYPNPLSQSATISLTSEFPTHAEISILNLLGIEVTHLFSGQLDASEHTFTWSPAPSLPNGVYECVVLTNGRVMKAPLVLLR